MTSPAPFHLEFAQPYKNERYFSFSISTMASDPPKAYESLLYYNSHRMPDAPPGLHLPNKSLLVQTNSSICGAAYAHHVHPTILVPDGSEVPLIPIKLTRALTKSCASFHFALRFHLLIRFPAIRLVALPEPKVLCSVHGITLVDCPCFDGLPPSAFILRHDPTNTRLFVYLKSRPIDPEFIRQRLGSDNKRQLVYYHQAGHYYIVFREHLCLHAPLALVRLPTDPDHFLPCHVTATDDTSDSQSTQHKRRRPNPLPLPPTLSSASLLAPTSMFHFSFPLTAIDPALCTFTSNSTSFSVTSAPTTPTTPPVHGHASTPRDPQSPASPASHACASTEPPTKTVDGATTVLAVPPPADVAQRQHNGDHGLPNPPKPNDHPVATPDSSAEVQSAAGPFNQWLHGASAYGGSAVTAATAQPSTAQLRTAVHQPVYGPGPVQQHQPHQQQQQQHHQLHQPTIEQQGQACAQWYNQHGSTTQWTYQQDGLQHYGQQQQQYHSVSDQLPAAQPWNQSYVQQWVAGLTSDVYSETAAASAGTGLQQSSQPQLPAQQHRPEVATSSTGPSPAVPGSAQGTNSIDSPNLRTPRPSPSAPQDTH